ncbi:MAG: HIT family protein [Elusimicrobiota bacterium]
MSEKKEEHNILWAPWRVKYVTQNNEGKCIFCAKSKEEKDKENYILSRGENAFAMLNIYPYNNGHIMIAPYQHTGEFEDLPKKTISEMMDMVKKYVKLIKQEMQAQGFNIGINIGAVAGAGIKDHIHIHVVPRWTGDTNYMPVIGKHEIISESLDSVYNKLKA